MVPTQQILFLQDVNWGHGFILQTARQSQLINESGAKSGFEMCFAPSPKGAGRKTLLESRIKKFFKTTFDVWFISQAIIIYFIS